MNEYNNLKIFNAKKLVLQVLLGDSSIQTMPKWVGFTTTTFCNLKCPQCQTHGTEEARSVYNAQHWEHDLTLRIASETLPAADGFCLTLTGEPLATPYFVELLAKLRPYGAKMHLTTNGSLMSKKMLIQVLPLVSAIAISIDGGTKYVVETIRAGIKFEKLVNRIRVLTRARELLRGIVKFPIRLAVTVMGSNIKDMPEVVRLALALGVDGVDFYPLIVMNATVADEAVELYVPLYKAYHKRTVEEGRRLGVNINFLLPQYADVPADLNFPVEGRNLLAKLPDNYYETLPLPESYLDIENIELEAAEIASTLRADMSSSARAIMFNDFEEFVRDYDRQLRELGQDADVEIPYCGELDARIFINSDGDVAPCCVPGRPSLGNIHKESVREIWMGKQRTDFWRRFHSSSPPDCCKGCRNRVFVSRRSLLKQILPETILAGFLRLLK